MKFGKTSIFETLEFSVCFFVPFILDVRLVDVPAGVTQEEGHTGFFIHLPSAVRALIFLARSIQPFLSLVDREVQFCVLTNYSFSTDWEKIPVRTTASGFELTSQRHKVSRLPTEPPGRPDLNPGFRRLFDNIYIYIYLLNLHFKTLDLEISGFLSKIEARNIRF